MIFRAAAIFLGIVGFVVFNFGVDLCTSIGNCAEIPVSSRGFLRPQEVQFVMLLASVVGMLTALIGAVRGPTTIIPAMIRKPFKRTETDEPLGVRGAMLFGASAVLIAVIVPLHGLATPVREGQAVTFYSTVMMAVVLVSYFGWHLGTEHQQWAKRR
jgi:hypothetical protein